MKNLRIRPLLKGKVGSRIFVVIGTTTFILAGIQMKTLNEMRMTSTIHTADMNCIPDEIVNVTSNAVEVSISKQDAVMVTSPEPQDEIEGYLEPEYYIDLSDDEIYAMASLIWLEGRGESENCQKAIASVLVNRYVNFPEKYSSMYDVIYEKNQFEPAKYVPYTCPEEMQLNVVKDVVQNGPTIPTYVTYFRASYYHSFGDLIDYTAMDHTYFSYSYRLRTEIEGM